MTNAKPIPRFAWAVWAVRHPSITIVSALHALFLGFVLIGPIVYEPSPIRTNIRATFQAPGPSHPLGTDELGRDVLARVLHGGRISLTAGIAVVAVGLVIGTIVGFLAGYFGGRLDFILMRLTDLFLGFPALILAIALAASLGAGLVQGVIAAGLVWWPGFARLVRGQVLAAKPLPYVEAARALGASHLRIMVRHVFPACVGEIVIKATLDVGLAVLFVASLGFLGLGAQPPAPEWGSMIAQARTYILDFWWVGFFPGAAIGVTVLLFNALGDAVQPLFRR